jgi:hypothetical protein
MYRTITLGSCVSVQGKFVRLTKDGRVTVRVGRKLFTGYSVSAMTAPPSAPAQRQTA